MLSCRVLAGNPIPTLEWIRRDQSPLYNDSELKSSGSHLIANIKVDETAEYECRASNAAGESRKTASITIREPQLQLTILPTTQILALVEGDDLNLFCSVAGSSSAFVQWVRPNILPIQINLEVAWPTRDYALLKTKNVTRNDEGVYTCIANTKDVQILERVTVFVRPKPKKSPCNPGYEGFFSS